MAWDHVEDVSHGGTDAHARFDWTNEWLGVAAYQQGFDVYEQGGFGVSGSAYSSTWSSDAYGGSWTPDGRYYAHHLGSDHWYVVDSEDFWLPANDSDWGTGGFIQLFEFISQTQLMMMDHFFNMQIIDWQSGSQEYSEGLDSGPTSGMASGNPSLGIYAYSDVTSTLQVRNLSDHSLVTTLGDPTGIIYAVEFDNPYNPYLFVGSADNNIYVYDANNSFSLVTTISVGSTVRDIRSNGSSIGVAHDGGAEIYDIQDGWGNVKSFSYSQATSIDIGQEDVAIATGDGIIHIHDASSSPPAAFGGQVTLDGSPVQGATVVIFDETDGVVDSIHTTDSNGEYSKYLDSAKTYHVMVQYDDGSTKYNDESQPFVPG